MTTQIKVLWGALIAVAIIAIGGYFYPPVRTALAGAISTTDYNATNLVGEFTASIGIQTPSFQQGGTTAATSVQSIVQVYSCSGTANSTSTEFAAASPYASTGTSTATVESITVTGEATTTSLLVGTSTASTGLSPVASSVTPVVASTTVGTSTPLYLAPGTPGYNSPGGGNFRTIQVAPSEFLVGEATSSWQSAQYAQGISCTVKVKWEQ
jgi:hypothetical protein